MNDDVFCYPYNTAPLLSLRWGLEIRLTPFVGQGL